LTALAIVAEIGDFERFHSAAEFMAFVGLVPSEHSSGERRRQASITKVGNAHVRRQLVESPAASAAKTRSFSPTPGGAKSACTHAGSGWPRVASPRRRSSSPARESSPASSGR
jgi:transposase